MGIVNGISYTDWDPKTDKMIYQNYDEKSVLKKKAKNKTELQKELGLPIDENKIMIGVVSRLTDQKGFDLVAYKLEELCAADVQIVVLGTGDEKYENLFRHYAWKYPEKLSAQIYFSNEMSHKIYAASDLFLMPSLFEPCGLSQLISFRYGTLPLVRETGGLKDTVAPYNEFTGEGNGFSFANYNADEMLGIIYYALGIYYDNRDAWNKIVLNAMKSDYSWDVSADKYIRMYQELTGIYDLPKKQEAPKKKKSSFEKQLKKDAEESEKEIVKKAATPKKVEVENPFGEEKPTAKKTVKKAEKKPAAKKTPAKKTAKKITKKEKDTN